MYVVYCQNKPRSEFIVIEYENFFEVSRRHINLIDYSGAGSLNCLAVLPSVCL